jgi:hypothetical protein
MGVMMGVVLLCDRQFSNDSNTGENNSSNITLGLTSANSLKEAINVNDYEGEVVKVITFY